MKTLVFCFVVTLIILAIAYGFPLDAGATGVAGQSCYMDWSEIVWISQRAVPDDWELRPGEQFDIDEEVLAFWDVDGKPGLLAFEIPIGSRAYRCFGDPKLYNGELYIPVRVWRQKCVTPVPFVPLPD